MNREWKREWGGETVVYEGDRIVSAALPKFNRALLFRGNQAHCARSVSRICPDTRRTLMFKCAVANADLKRDNLQLFLESIGATNKKHRYSSLAGHLLFTYDLLKAAGQSDDICLAGGCHSIFGTNAFKDACLPIEQHHVAQRVIGHDATLLSLLFSMIDRPAILESMVGQPADLLPLRDGRQARVEPWHIGALCMIEAANLCDQYGLDAYPKLKQLWSTVYTPK
jgi:hypothetical protein